MKNVTVSLDDDTYRRARVRAAEQGRSLSAVVREFLKGLGGGETEFERLKRLQDELFTGSAGKGNGQSSVRLSREDMYDEIFRERFPTLSAAQDRAE